MEDLNLEKNNPLVIGVHIHPFATAKTLGTDHNGLWGLAISQAP